MIDNPWFFAAALPAVFINGVSKGGFASGLGIVSVPLMALTVPVTEAAAIMLPILCVMDLAALWVYRRNWDRENMKIMLPAGLAGLVLGALGGADGGVNRVRIERGATSYVPPHLSKDQDIEMQPGDRICVSTPGGGGFGDPFKRDPRRVARDVVRGYYTKAQAERMFGVAIAGNSEADTTRTVALRANAVALRAK